MKNCRGKFPKGKAMQYLRNRKHVPCFYRIMETRGEMWENEKCCGKTSRKRVFPQLFRVLQNFHDCFYNSIETRKTCFLFLLENTATNKRRATHFDYQNVNFICSRHHYVKLVPVVCFYRVRTTNFNLCFNLCLSNCLYYSRSILWNN